MILFTIQFTRIITEVPLAYFIEGKSMQIPLFLAIGFMFAVLYIDLVFDMSALPYRNKAAIPKEVMDSI